LRTSNFKFEFVFIFQPFDIQIQASLIKCRRFCLESGALLFQRCTVWWFLCSLPVINSSAAAAAVFAYPSPPLPAYRRGVQLLSCTAPLAPVVYWSKLSKWQILVAQTQSRHQSTAIERDVAWLIALLIDCFPACGVRAVTISPHSADIKCKLLKILRKYMYEVWIWSEF